MATDAFDHDAARVARDGAIATVDDAASEAWKEAALAAVRYVCERRAQFTTDAVWFVLDRTAVDAPNEPRAMGAIMRQAVAAGWCAPVPDQTRKSVRVACHRRPLQVWESRITAREAGQLTAG